VGRSRAMSSALPPSYVNVPVSIVYAEADDALLVTMTRILGLCWAYDYERTPALTPEQLAEFTGRPRSTLYRHLKHLREMQWIRVEQAGRRIVIRPIVTLYARAVGGQAAETVDPADEPIPDEALLLALADIGVENPKRSQLAGLDIDPVLAEYSHPFKDSSFKVNSPFGLFVRISGSLTG
jgi:DNA-binding MarR family transcriptional regulator